MAIIYLNAPQGALPHGLLIFLIAFSAQKRRTKRLKKSSLNCAVFELGLSL
jgi:hypothetical protein